MTILGISNIKSIFYLFKYHNPFQIIYLSSFIIIVNNFIQSYIWGDYLEYWFLISLIFVDFITGFWKAMKRRIINARKIPKFLFTIILYSLLLILAYQGAKITQLLIWTPSLFYSVFVLATIYSIIENVAALEILPTFITNFLHEKVGLKLSEFLSLKKEQVISEYKKDIFSLLINKTLRSSVDRAILLLLIPTFEDKENYINLEVIFDEINIQNIPTDKLFKVINEYTFEYKVLIRELKMAKYKYIRKSFASEDEKKILNEIGMQSAYIFNIVTDENLLDGLFICGLTSERELSQTNLDLILRQIEKIQPIVNNFLKLK